MKRWKEKKQQPTENAKILSVENTVKEAGTAE